MNLGAAALNQTPLDWKGNMARIESVIRAAEGVGCDLLCLPELCITGYGCEDMFLAPYVLDRAKRQLVDLALSLRGRRAPIVAVGLPIAHGGSVYNCVAVIEEGKVRGIVPKQNLARDGVHYEPRWFRPWPAGEVSDVKLDEWGNVPFGDLIFEINLYSRDSVRFGFEICEDAWVASRPGSRLAQRNVDVILNPSASHFSIGKHDIRRLFVSEGSRAFNCAYVYANLLGNESGRLIFDGATLIASGGKIINEGKRLSFREAQITCQKVDLEPNRVQRRSREGFSSGDEATVVKLKDPNTKVSNSSVSKAVTLSPFEEFTRAVALGLFDYMRKSRTKGYVVSLSGGADSSAVAVLVAEMVRIARCEPDCLPSISGWDVENLLTCIYQPTKYSSEETYESAKRLAESIGARFMTIPVNKIFNRYKEVVGKALDVEWSWDEHDIPLQNIQARLRSPSAWMVANVLDQILLSTSNRSEAAVGYATMDGDTSGGLAPIAGIDKAFLLRWLKWIEGRRYPGLDAVNALTPTAELKPSEANQTDEGDLMPYPVLDAIEHHAIQNKQSPFSVLVKLIEEFEYYSSEELSGWIIKFYKLWCRNQWKRERYAPAFHVDEKNLDPKTWCRFPILSSGFEDELKRIVLGHND